MLKKFSVAIAALSVILTGLTSSAASATSYTSNAYSNLLGALWSGNLPSNGQIQVPANAKRISFSKQWYWEGSAVDDVKGKTVILDWSLTLPNNTVVNAANASTQGFNAYSFGNLNGIGVYKSINPSPQSTALVMTGDEGANYTTANVSLDLYAYNNTVLSAGTYTLSVTVKIDGVAYTNFTTSGANNAYLDRNSFWVTGGKTLTTSLNVDYLGRDKITVMANTCVDTSLISVGDVLTVRRLIDGVEAQNQVSGVSRSLYINNLINNNQSWPQLSGGSGATYTHTVNQNGIDLGLEFESELEFIDSASSNPNLSVNNGLSAGNHTFEISVVNQDGVEVSGGCVPPTPNAPTISISGVNVSGSAFGAFMPSQDASYSCQAYKVSDNTAIGQATNGYATNNVNGVYTTLNCGSFNGIPGGTQFYVKIKATSALYSNWTSTSAASNTLTMPSSGVTITTTPSNGATFGNLKSVVPVDIVNFSGTPATASTGITEPTGGTIELARSMNSVSLRRITETGLDATFGTKITASPYQSFSASGGFHGTALAPKPFVIISAQTVNTAVTIKDYNLNGTDGATREVSNNQLKALCAEAFDSSYTTVFGAYAVSAPTSDVYFQVGCDNGGLTGYLLARINLAGTSAPVLITDFGTPTADTSGLVTYGNMVGQTGVPVSLNWTATGSTPMLTFLAMPLKYGNCNPSCAATYLGTAKLHRISAAGAVLSATNAGISNPAPNSSSFNVGISPINFGDLIVSRREQAAPTQQVPMPPLVVQYFKAGASGAVSSINTTWDTTDGIAAQAINNLGLVVGKTSDGQLVFLRSASAAGATTYKLAKINLATGAVTTFGEALRFTTSGSASFYTAVGLNNTFRFIAQSAVNSGKMDIVSSVAAGNVVAPTVPVPAGDENTDLGRSLNAGGTKITITGTALNVVTGVKFGTVTAKFTNTATSLVITVPAGATGTSAVTVLYAGGTISVGDWEYMGATKRVQTLTPTGLGAATFTGASDANRNLSVASSIDGYTPTITSKTPTVCTFAQGVIDFVGNGTCIIQATQAGDAITAPATSTYEIYYESPITASALYSTDAAKPTITLNGVGLGAVSKVMFGNVEVAPTKKTDTSITVKVPAAPSAGANVDVQLKYNNGTIVDTDLDFDFVGALQIEQTLTFSAGFALAVYGDAVRTLSTISKDVADDVLPDLPYVYSTSTPDVCKVDGDQLRFLAGGTCTVKVSQAGNVGVKPATAEFNIIVSKNAQTVTVNNTLSVTNVTGANLGATNSNEEVVLDYESSDESICTVDGDGFVTGIAQGSCEITITAEGDDRYLEDVKTVTVTVTDDPTDPAPEAADVVDETPIAISNGGANAFISLSDPSLQVSWDKANGKLTPRATGVYTGNIVATLKFAVGGVDKFCTTIFGSTTPLKVPAKPVLPENATPKQALAYAKAFAAYKKAYNAAFGSKIFKSAVFCADGNKLTGTTFGTLKKVAKTAAEKKVEAANLKLLKNFTGNVEISVKRWRAWPTTAKNRTGNGNVGKTIPATKNINTLTLG